MCIDVLEHELHAFQVALVSLLFCGADLLRLCEHQEEKPADDLPDSEFITVRFIAQDIGELQDQFDHTDPAGSIGPDMENGKALAAKDGSEILPVDIASEFAGQKA